MPPFDHAHGLWQDHRHDAKASFPHMTSGSPEARVPLTGIWLSAEPIQTPIETLVIDMLASTLASRALREAELEELRRGVKLADVALEYLGLRTISVDGDGDPLLRVVASDSPRDPWRDALVLPRRSTHRHPDQHHRR